MDGGAGQTRVVALPHPIDVVRTLRGVHRAGDTLSYRRSGTEIWRASRTPEGPATLRLVVATDQVEATAWGDGASAILEGVPGLIGIDDDDGGFAPDHKVLAKVWRDYRGVRMPRSGAVAETLLACVLEQRVTTFEAGRSLRQITTRWGEPAPGPGNLMLPPDPEVLAGVPYYELHVAGVERARSDTLKRVAANASRINGLVDGPADEARRKMEAIVGVGPWTSAEVALVALGDADAVPVGDVHLPRDVTYVLTGTGVDDDEAMLDALEPFRGQRGRVIRLLGAAGLHAPRRAPRYAPREMDPS